MVDTNPNPNPNPKTAFFLKKKTSNPAQAPALIPTKTPTPRFTNIRFFLSGQTIAAANKLLIKIILTSS